MAANISGVAPPYMNSMHGSHCTLLHVLILYVYKCTLQCMQKHESVFIILIAYIIIIAYIVINQWSLLYI